MAATDFLSANPPANPAGPSFSTTTGPQSGAARQQEALDRAVELISRTRSDPVWFIQGALQAKLWAKQREVARDVFLHRRVAVKACHSSGKTFLSAGIIHAFFHAFPGCKILTTAPSGDQVEGQLWPEIRVLARRLPKDLGVRVYEGRPMMRATDEWWAQGRSTDRGVRFQGFHAPKMLMVVDEAVGVSGEIFEAMEGNRAGGDVHVLLLGNPTVPGGPFYDAFSNPYDPQTNPTGWVCHTISAFDTPNFAGVATLGADGLVDVEATVRQLLALTYDELYTNAVPYLTTRFWVAERWHEWGEGSPMWQGRILGQFPEQSADSLFPLAGLEAARKRPAVQSLEVLPPDVAQTARLAQEPVRIGLDVAGPGEDETVGYVRCGPDVLEVKAWGTPDPRDVVCEWLRGWMSRAASWGRDVDRISIDAIGIGYNFGLAVQDFIRTLPGVERTDGRVKLVNVGQGATQNERYTNRRAEEYWGLRLRFSHGEIAHFTDAATYAQLAALRYREQGGKVLIESKADAKKRGIKSPDRADALMLAFASDRTPGMLGYYDRRYQEMLLDRTLTPAERDAKAVLRRDELEELRKSLRATGGSALATAMRAAGIGAAKDSAGQNH